MIRNPHQAHPPGTFAYSCHKRIFLVQMQNASSWCKRILLVQPHPRGTKEACPRRVVHQRRVLLVLQQRGDPGRDHPPQPPALPTAERHGRAR